jgi:hypothetical protein
MQDFINKCTTFEDQLINFKSLVVDEYPNPMGLFAVIGKRDFDDAFSKFISNLIFRSTLE